MRREEILAEASRLITQDRNNQYGEPEDAFADIAAYWSAYLKQDINPLDVGLMMMLMKVARAQNNPGKLDSYVDMAGYAGCAGEIAYASRPPKPRPAKIPLDLEAIRNSPVMLTPGEAPTTAPASFQPAPAAAPEAKNAPASPQPAPAVPSAPPPSVKEAREEGDWESAFTHSKRGLTPND